MTERDASGKFVRACHAYNKALNMVSSKTEDYMDGYREGYEVGYKYGGDMKAFKVGIACLILGALAVDAVIFILSKVFQ